MRFQALLFFLCFGYTLTFAQLNEASFIDSLKRCEYLKEYFSKYAEYSDSTYVNYLSTYAELDTFEIDTNAGFGFKPTKITLIYKKLNYIRFYTGLHVSRFENKQISELAFYNFASQKTGLSWTFHPNGNIKTITKYQPVSMDTITQFGQVLEPKGNYSIMQFYKTGNIELTGAYKGNEKSGSWIYFDKKGKMYRTENFKKGKRINKTNF